MNRRSFIQLLGSIGIVLALPVPADTRPVVPVRPFVPNPCQRCGEALGKPSEQIDDEDLTGEESAQVIAIDCPPHSYDGTRVNYRVHWRCLQPGDFYGRPMGMNRALRHQISESLARMWSA